MPAVALAGASPGRPCKHARSSVGFLSLCGLRHWVVSCYPAAALLPDLPFCCSAVLLGIVACCSWGTGNGDKGFFKVRYGVCGMLAPGDTLGVSFIPAQPLGLPVAGPAPDPVVQADNKSRTCYNYTVRGTSCADCRCAACSAQTRQLQTSDARCPGCGCQHGHVTTFVNDVPTFHGRAFCSNNPHVFLCSPYALTNSTATSCTLATCCHVLPRPTHEESSC